MANYQLARDRSRRQVRPPTRYDYSTNDLYFCALISSHEINGIEPASLGEALKSTHKLEWEAAMKEEMSSLRKNHPKPKNQKLVECKWLFKVKEELLPIDPVRFKARLVAKAFTQRE